MKTKLGRSEPAGPAPGRVSARATAARSVASGAAAAAIGSGIEVVASCTAGRSATTPELLSPRAAELVCDETGATIARGALASEDEKASSGREWFTISRDGLWACPTKAPVKSPGGA